MEEQKVCPECGGKAFKKETSIEVGNIFELKTKFSEPFNLTFKNEGGEDKLVLMGCYGIGLGRVMGAIVEVLSDEKGIVWPASVAPFQVHLLQLGSEEDVKKNAEKLYQELQKNNIEVLYDDRDISAGEKFADADLVGIPTRIVVSGKTLKAGKLELKDRTSGVVSMASEKEILNMIKKSI